MHLGLQENVPGARDQGYPWFALRVRSNHERVASIHLQGKGFEQFSPCYEAERQWSDRRRTIEKALFPGYIFCRLNPQDRLPVLTIPGVVNVVGFGQGPTPIPECEIENVRKLVDSGLMVGPWPFLREGESVLIERGPLAGIEGVLQKVKGTFQLVVSIQLLQRSVSAQVERGWVRPITSHIRPIPESRERHYAPSRSVGVMATRI